MDRRERSGRRGKALALCGFALALSGLIPIAAPAPARAVELSAAGGGAVQHGVDFPASAQSMTVCYAFRLQTPRDAGFHPRRPQRLDADPRDGARIGCRRTVSGAEGRDLVRSPHGAGDGTDKRVAKADFRYFDDKHNYDCWDTTRNTPACCWCCRNGACSNIMWVGDPHYAAMRWYCRRRTTRQCWSTGATKVEWVVEYVAARPICSRRSHDS